MTVKDVNKVTVCWVDGVWSGPIIPRAWGFMSKRSAEVFSSDLILYFHNGRLKCLDTTDDQSVQKEFVCLGFKIERTECKSLYGFGI